MLLNEEEAMEKECRAGGYMPPTAPFSASGSAFSGSAGGFPRCIASGCMAWRWEQLAEYAGGAYAGARNGTRGYCGMAGKVE